MAEAARGTIASPCVNVCRMDAGSNLCEGCARTLDEIAGWSTMDDAAKRAVWALLPKRRDRMNADAPADVARRTVTTGPKFT